MKNIFKICILLALVNLAFGDEAKEDDKSLLPKNYSLNAQVGMQYTQGYGDINSGIFDGEKSNFQNIFASVGFEGLEFEHLAFGASLLGSINLNSNTSIYNVNISSNALLYKLFVGFRSEYVDISLGREELELEWVNDFVEGARASFKIPDFSTELSAYYFYRKAVASIDEMSDFTSNKLGHSIVLGISNHTLENFIAEAYFMDIDIFNAFWLGGVLDFDFDDFTSNTILKYAFFNSKSVESSNVNYLQLEQNLTFKNDFGDIAVILGGIKVFSKDSPTMLEFNKLGDQNPLEQGDQVYFDNALSLYAGLTYNFRDYFNAKLVYGNSSNARLDSSALKPISEIDFGLGGSIKGLEISLLYSKLLSKTLPNNPQARLNRDYIKAMIAYDF